MIPGLGRLRQDYGIYEANLDYLVSCSLVGSTGLRSLSQNKIKVSKWHLDVPEGWWELVKPQDDASLTQDRDGVTMYSKFENHEREGTVT